MDQKPYANAVLEQSLLSCLQRERGPGWRRMELRGGEAQQVALGPTK